MNKGFYTAMGTAVNADGSFCWNGMARHVEQQIEAGVSGMLVMGSMGMQPYIKNSEYAKVAACSAETAAGRAPVLVGVTDMSIGRVLERIEALKGIKGIDGVVSTLPYYSPCNQQHAYDFYNEIAKNSPWPVYMYDLPGVVKAAIAPDTVKKLWKNPNIKGIKSGNMVTHRILMRSEDRPEDFTMMFSNIDEFDVAYKFGIDKNLDGMFAATPATAKKMYAALDAGDYAAAGDYLDKILELRDMFLATGSLLRGAFTHSMNLLGCDGIYGRDYEKDISDEWKEKIAALMKEMGEI